MLIPGPTSPGNDIDIYLKPLVDELKDLWDFGIKTYDAFKKESFDMFAALLCTISDFPAYSMLSGWKTKGRYACPTCNYNTDSLYLKHSRKTCYMGHRRFLQREHPWRLDARSFNGGKEERVTPTALSGSEVLQQLSNVENDFGKAKHKRKGKELDTPWKKRSIVFELPYWKDNRCRHNFDVMHIEKNVCDNIIGTLLDIPGKSKDHTKARLDLLELGVKEDLQPFISTDGEHITLPPAPFSTDHAQKDLFLKVFMETKFPYGCASNIARCVQDRERRLTGYKSHDAHILLHYLLQVAVRNSLPKNVSVPLIRLGNFFRRLCSKVISHEELDFLENEIIEILCELERVFVPSFFDIMVHLPIHLVNEIRLGGPVQYRSMFAVERYLCKFKSHVRNRCYPEGCMAECYLAEECLTFCSRYLHDGVKTRLDRRSTHYMRNETNSSMHQNSFFPKVGHPLGGKKTRTGKAFMLDQENLKQAHRYVIFNCDCEQVEKYIE